MTAPRVLAISHLPAQTLCIRNWNCTCRQFCQDHGVARLCLFGSAIREDFGETSDVDLLVEFATHAEPSLRELSTMQNELERLLGRPVDLVERKAIEQSRNYILRKHVLGQIEPIYVA